MGRAYSGKVYLVGAGPGDPELITLKALNILKRAEVILYDSLLNEEILKNAPQGCEKIFVGKRFGKHSLMQDELNQLLYENAIRRKTVVRLKGGDPFIFGRGGEEIGFLQEKNIQVEVIPGVTTAVAASASLKTPLTHRDLGQSVIFLSGYSKEGNQADGYLPPYDWRFLANTSLTLVFYMGLKNLDIIAKKLIEHGKPLHTKAAIISNCTLPDEKVLITSLEKMQTQAGSGQIKFPAIILIGEVIGNSQPSHPKELPGPDELPDEASKTKWEEKITRPKLSKAQTLLLILFHGAKKLERLTLPSEFIQELSKKIDHRLIRHAFLTESLTPSFHEVMAEAGSDSSIQRVEVFPIFLLPGKHLDEDIPELVAHFQKKYPGLKINLHPPPHIISDFLPKIAELIKEALRK